MNMGTHMEIVGKINKGFKTKKDRLRGSHQLADKSFVTLVSEGLGKFYFESTELTADEIQDVIGKPMGMYGVKELLSDSIYNAVLLVDGRELRVTGIPKKDLLDSEMKC